VAVSWVVAHRSTSSGAAGELRAGSGAATEAAAPASRARHLPAVGAAWSVAPVVLAVTVLGRSAQNAAQTTYPLIGKDLLGLSSGVLGAVVAAAGLCGVLASTVVVGRLPARRSMVLVAVGQGLGTATFVLCALPTGRIGLVAAALALGAGGGLIFPALMTTVSSSGRSPLQSKPLAVFGVALSTSLVVGPLVEAGVLHLVGGSLRATFGALLPLPVAATALAVVAVVRDPGASRPRRRHPGPDPHLAPPAAGPPPPPTAEPPALPGGPAVDAPVTDRSGGNNRTSDAAHPPLWRQPAFRLATATMLTYQVPFVALVAFGGILARRVDHASSADVELAFGVFFGLSLAVRALLAWRLHGRGTRTILSAAVVATVAGVAVVGTAHQLPLLVAGMAVLGVPHGTTFPMASALLAERTAKDDLPRANGRLMATTNSATVAVPFIAGVLAQAVGYRDMFLLLELPVLVLGGVLLRQLALLT
jgi:DHA1 family multidrug resistance protein-like MFS transporter